MNTDWDIAINFVLREEGGENGELVTNDKGGYTKFGIASAANPDVDVPALTREQAIALYKERYWNPCHCDELPSPVAIVVFDAAVNQGVKTAVRMLQIALGTVDVDGVIGDATIAAAHKASASLTRRILAQRMTRYLKTVAGDKTQADSFAENWSGRLMRCAELTMKMVTV